VLRVVFDPGVLVSAVISPGGPPADALDAWRDGAFDLVVSPLLLEELEDVLMRPKFRSYASAPDVEEYIEALTGAALAFEDPGERRAFTADADDDYLVALALAVGADAIVSGDKHLIEMPEPPVQVMTPRDLLEWLR
jgi:putative PIN family toxin of toxin-antitoxin system